MYQRFMCEQHLAHLFSISLNCKESRQTGTQPIIFFRIFAENLTLNILLNYETNNHTVYFAFFSFLWPF